MLAVVAEEEKEEVLAGANAVSSPEAGHLRVPDGHGWRQVVVTSRLQEAEHLVEAVVAAGPPTMAALGGVLRNVLLRDTSFFDRHVHGLFVFPLGVHRREEVEAMGHAGRHSKEGRVVGPRKVVVVSGHSTPIEDVWDNAVGAHTFHVRTD